MIRLAILPLLLAQCGPQAVRPPAPPVFRPPVTTVEGQVLAAGVGTPLNGIRVYTTPATAVALTDSQGRYILNSAAFEYGLLYRVTAEGPGYVPATLEANGLQPGQANALPPLMLLSGGGETPPEPPDLSQEAEDPAIQPPMLDP